MPSSGEARLVPVRRFLTPRWLVRHLAAAVMVAVFVLLGWWQLGRAQSGNMLSYGYAVEWPLFALFVLFVWGRELRGELHGWDPPEQPPVPAEPGLLTQVPVRKREIVAGDSDPVLDAYNEYLTWLAEHPDSRPSDYPKGG
jgi:hypothetical protein